MKQTDLYIFRRLLSVYLFALLAFLLLYCFIDSFNQSHDIVGPDHKTAWGLLAWFYLVSIPGLILMSNGIILCLCNLFVYIRLKNTSQLIAYNASGISIWRIQLSMTFVSLLSGIFIFCLHNFILPSAQKDMLRIDERNSNLGKIMSYCSFKDILNWQGSEIEKITGIASATSVVEIEKINGSNGKISGWHSLVYNERDVPICKIYAESGEWHKNGDVELFNGTVLFFFQSDFPHNLSSLKFPKITLNLSVKQDAVLWSAIDLDCLSIFDLVHFSESEQHLIEFSFRIFDIFQPTLMMILCSFLALPLLLKGFPTIAGFATLAISSSVYATLGSIKEQLIAKNLAVDSVFISMAIIMVFVLLFQKSYLQKLS